MNALKMKTKKSDILFVLLLFLALSLSFVACEQEVATPETTELGPTTVETLSVLTTSSSYRMHAINCTEAPGVSQDYEPYIMTISRNPAAEDAVFLANFAGLGHAVQAFTTGSEFTIPFQVFQTTGREYRLRGSGEYSSDDISLSYKMDVIENDGTTRMKHVICESTGFGI
jgi:hypothetical protein